MPWKKGLYSSDWLKSGVDFTASGVIGTVFSPAKEFFCEAHGPDYLQEGPPTTNRQHGIL